MWSYYGSKSKIVDFYPPPKYSTIIEPFAGSARYSLKYWDRNILLVDKYDKLVAIWKWLQSCSKDDILKLPNMSAGEKLDNYNFDNIEAKWLMGFIISAGECRPSKTVSPFCSSTYRIKHHKEKIAADLYKIKHWDIRVGDYTDIDNQKATWFIDPPYQFGGEHYAKSNKLINFNYLADWCRNRDGQVIVCENTKADWMPFKPIKTFRGSKFKTTEAIWSNEQTNYDYVQAELFQTI